MSINWLQKLSRSVTSRPNVGLHSDASRAPDTRGQCLISHDCPVMSTCSRNVWHLSFWSKCNIYIKIQFITCKSYDKLMNNRLNENEMDSSCSHSSFSADYKKLLCLHSLLRWRNHPWHCSRPQVRHGRSHFIGRFRSWGTNKEWVREGLRTKFCGKDFQKPLFQWPSRRKLRL